MTPKTKDNFLQDIRFILYLAASKLSRPQRLLLFVRSPVYVETGCALLATIPSCVCASGSLSPHILLKPVLFGRSLSSIQCQVRENSNRKKLETGSQDTAESVFPCNISSKF